MNVAILMVFHVTCDSLANAKKKTIGGPETCFYITPWSTRTTLYTKKSQIMITIFADIEFEVGFVCLYSDFVPIPKRRNS